jgi:integrase
MRYKTIGSEYLFEDKAITKKLIVGYSSHFGKLFKELGMHDFSFHNLRHSFSSLLQSDLGIGAVVVQGMTGHSSLGMLQKYSHTGLDSKKRAIQSLTNHVLGMGKKKILPMVSQTGTI